MPHNPLETTLVPLIAKNEVIGHLIVTLTCPANGNSHDQSIFSQRQTELLRNIANQTAQAIASDHLQQWRDE